MESHTNYEDFDEMEYPENFTESQGMPSTEAQQQSNGMSDSFNRIRFISSLN